TSVSRASGPDESSAANHKTDRQLLNCHVVHNLVVGPLQEGRIDRNEWLVPLRREARREGDSVLLGNSDIEGSLRKRLGENVDASTARHRRGNGDDLVVLFGFLHQAFAEN